MPCPMQSFSGGVSRHMLGRYGVDVYQTICYVLHDCNLSVSVTLPACPARAFQNCTCEFAVDSHCLFIYARVGGLPETSIYKTHKHELVR